jgi:hypothetical protein
MIVNDAALAAGYPRTVGPAVGSIHARGTPPRHSLKSTTEYKLEKKIATTKVESRESTSLYW